MSPKQPPAGSTIDRATIDYLIEQTSERCAQRIAPLMEAITTLMVEQRYLYEAIERLEWMLGLEDDEKLREMPSA